MQRRGAGVTLAAFGVVFCILFILAVASEIFVREELHPRSKFQNLLLTTILSGLLAGLVIEKMNLRLLE